VLLGKTMDIHKHRAFIFEAHKRAVIRFIAHHGWTTSTILQSYLELKTSASMNAKLKSYIKADLLARLEYKNPLGGKSNYVYKLSTNGIAEARLLASEPAEEVRMSENQISHKLLIQRIHVVLMGMGYFGFEVERSIKNAIDLYGHYPDIACQNKKGQKVVFEAERTVKSKSRYCQIIADFYNARANGELDAVVYVCEDVKTRASLVNTIQRALSDQFTRKGKTLHLNFNDIKKWIKFVTINELKPSKKALEMDLWVDLAGSEVGAIIHRHGSTTVLEPCGVYDIKQLETRYEDCLVFDPMGEPTLTNLQSRKSAYLLSL